MPTAVRPSLDPDTLDDVDLADPAVHAEHDLSALWRHLRTEEPVYRHPETGGRPGFWVLTRHADVAAVLRDSARFTSERGNVLDTLLTGGDSAAGKMLAVTDGEPHRDLRTVLLKSFTPRALAPVIESVRRSTRQLLEEALGRGDCDFAREVAANIPIAAICDLLGVPAKDRAYILALTSSALGSDHGLPTEADTWTAKNDILLYFAELAADRREKPLDDVVSLLVSDAFGDRPLTHDEVVFNCYSLLLGGDETTRLSMIGAIEALIEHPDQWAALRSGAVSVESATEEVLRWTTPALHSGRTATEDLLLEGEFVEEGDVVTVWTASANRDEAVFDRPEVFDLARSGNRHLSFAYGAHFCLGAYLARAEIGAVLEGVRAMASELSFAGPSSRVYSNFLSGLSQLPVSVSLDPRYRPAER
ncbi:cytochrome P450 [Streptacidiphilus rugosus]|uniref:cytochrome P450 n=1 Tax=Streptacidiphilus rugosus TaxID=405783 RepID=UPI00056778CB|nr:cytochrome P450 [Streptacidiphilus rugosus]